MLVLIDNYFPWFGDMLELGGQILLVIIILAALMWSLILERLIYFWIIYPQHLDTAVRLWRKRREHPAWFDRQYRRMLVSRMETDMKRNLSFIRTLVKVCPLLGLLGTVMGMLEIFDAIALTGSNNPRSTASGISKATVTTMAGMVVAISGLMISNYLTNRADNETTFLGERLSESVSAGKRGEQQNA